MSLQPARLVLSSRLCGRFFRPFPPACLGGSEVLAGLSPGSREERRGCGIRIEIHPSFIATTLERNKFFGQNFSYNAPKLPFRLLIKKVS